MAYYNNPYSPLLIYFTQINGGGGRTWALVPLAMPVTVVIPGFVNEGLKRGSEAPERGDGYAPTVGVFPFIDPLLLTHFSDTVF